MSVFQASERRMDNEGEDSERWSTLATVEISITDVNDNPPLFSPKQYTVDMDENLPDGSTIPELNIRVVDHDQVSWFILYLTVLLK